MSEMIERVARAAFEYEQPDNKHFPSAGGWDGPLLNERGKNYYRGLARAAIEALREPTDAMLNAGPPEPYMDRYVWVKMIDAALEVKANSDPMCGQCTEPARGPHHPECIHYCDDAWKEGK